MTVKPGAYVARGLRYRGRHDRRSARRICSSRSSRPKSVGKGTGLGLAMVYGAVRQNGGHIEVHSQVDQGSAFEVYMPAATSGSAFPKPPLPAAAIAQARGTSILLVEDEQAVRSFATRALRRSGHEIHAFANGEDALAALSS